MNSAKFLVSTLIAAAAMSATAYADVTYNGITWTDSDGIRTFTGTATGYVLINGTGANNGLNGAENITTLVFDSVGGTGNAAWFSNSETSQDIKLLGSGLVIKGGTSYGPAVFTGDFLAGDDSALITWNGDSAGNGQTYRFEGNLTEFNGSFSRSTATTGNLFFGKETATEYSGTATDGTISNISGTGSISTAAGVIYNYASSESYMTLSVGNSSISAKTLTFQGGANYLLSTATTNLSVTNTLSVGQSTTLNLDLASDMTLSSALSGAGTLKKSGDGNLMFSGSVASGTTLEISEGSATISCSSQEFNGNLVVGKDAKVVSAVTDAIPWGGSNHLQTVRVLGELELNERWSMNSNKKLIMAGGEVTGTGATASAHRGVALDFFASGTLLAEAGTTSSIEAGIRISGGQTLTVDTETGSTLSVAKIWGGSNVNSHVDANLKKTGAGTLVFTSADANYGGTTLVDNGILEIAVGHDNTFTQGGAITTTGEGKIKVTSGTLALTGTVNLSNAIENTGTVTVTSDAKFDLSNLKGVSSSSGTLFSLVSGGTTTFADGMGIGNVVGLTGTTVALRNGTATAVFSEGAVTISGTSAGTLTWNGTEGNSTWNYSAENWSGDGTTFINGDNVIFSSGAGVSSKVSLEAGKTLGVGNVTIEGGSSYTFATSAGSISTINGKTLDVASGVTLNVGDNDGHNDSGGIRAVRLNFEAIRLSGKIFYENGATSWSSLEFVGEGESADGVRHLEIYDTHETGLTIGRTIVSNDAKITATWGGKVALGDLVLNANLSLGSGGDQQYFVSSITGEGNLDVGAQLTFQEEVSTFSGSITGNGNIVVASDNLVWTGTRSGKGTITIEAGATLDASDENAKLFVVEGSSGDGSWHQQTGGLTVKAGAELKVHSLAYNSTLGALSHYAHNRVLDGGKITIVGKIVDESIGNAQQGFKVTESGGTLEVANADSKVLFSGGGNTDTIILGGALSIGGAGDIEINNSNGGNTAVSGSGSLTKYGSGTLVLSSSNTYSGGTTVSAGTLVAAHQNALGSGDVSVAQGATLQINTADISIKNLSGSGTVFVTTDANLTIESNKDTEFSGTFARSGSASSLGIAKTGAGTLTLKSEGFFGGGEIQVLKGTLAIGYSGALLQGNVKVSAGANLAVGTMVIAESVEFASGAKLVVDLGNLAVPADANANNAVIPVDVIMSEVIDFGGVTLSEGDSITLPDGYVTFDNPGILETYVKQTWSYKGGVLSLTLAIPEPSLFGLLAGLGALTLVGTRRRRKKA